MYNPSRGGVRGGADQFTWESVKTDKHRENYLGHSLKAPVGRWQKGKDLSWYVKERKDTEDAKIADKSELAAIKREEQEAMLIALGHNVIRKENQSLSKEEMKEALKRNIGDRDQLNIERVDGVGAKSGRAALLTGARSKNNNSVTFETHKTTDTVDEVSKEESPSIRRSKNKKKSKKHKKEKKKKSHNKNYSDDSENELPSRKEYRNDKTRKGNNTEDSGDETSSKHRHKKEKKLKRRYDLSDSDICRSESSSRKKLRNVGLKKRHDTEESNDSEDDSTYRHKQRKEKSRRHDSSDSDEPSNSDFNKRHKKDKLNKKY